jgi:hypothetical protein
LFDVEERFLCSDRSEMPAPPAAQICGRLVGSPSSKCKDGNAMLVELVERAENGDAEAYTELVRKFQDAVFATAYQTVLDYVPLRKAGAA